MIKVNQEEVARLRASGEFDADWYLARYPDVAQSGFDPAEHFVWLGRRLGRSMRAESARMPGSKTQDIQVASQCDATVDALFIDGTNGTSSTPYRVTRIANGLRAEGWKVRVEQAQDLLTLMQQDIRARFVIFHRAPWWSPFPEFVAQLRERGAIVVFDVDDLIFDEAVVPHIDAFKTLSAADQEGFLNGCRAYRQFILNADMCTSTTSFLCDEIAKLGKPTYLIRNAISAENVEFFENAQYRRKGRPSPFVVGYYSGTKTHQADFAVCAPALIKFMHERPEVVFRLIGEFDLDPWPELEYWRHVHRPGDLPRVTRIGLMPHDVMIRDQFSCDLIIAPLEVGNPFCEAKSELKYFEASLASCPVIASGTRTFIEASEDGRLADICVTNDDWYAAFNRTFDNYKIALNRARHAFDQVRYNYSQRFAANQALDAYEDFADRRAGRSRNLETSALAGRVADVGVIIPDFGGPSGGHRKIFAVCRALEDIGLSLAIYVYTNRNPKIIKRDIAKYFVSLDAEVVIFHGKVEAHQALICTQWKTAYDARLIEFSGRVLYFVQDFEPLFSAAGADQIRALVALKSGFEIICYGRWVAAKIKDETGIDSKLIPFTLDHAVYVKPPLEVSRDIDILVFARPSQDRRCLDLIVEGLVRISHERPDVRIGLFGEDDYEDFGFSYTNFGSIADVSALASLYRRAKIGICFSPTNPSQLGYEMIACGVCLVDVRIKFHELNFGGEAFVSYTDGEPENLAEICSQLLDDERERSRRQAGGYAFVEKMLPDAELGRQFVASAGLASTSASMTNFRNANAN